MAQILIGGLTEEQRGKLQMMAGLMAARDCRRVSMSGLAREIITQWLEENAVGDDRPVSEWLSQAD